jgi:hypothetical protein
MSAIARQTAHVLFLYDHISNARCARGPHSSTPAGNGACHLRWSMPSLFSGRRDGTHPLAARTCEPRPLPRPGRSARQHRWVPQKPGTRPTDRFAGQPERRQPIRRSGRDPGLLTLRPRQLIVGEAAPGAPPTLSLPTLNGRLPCRPRGCPHAEHPILDMLCVPLCGRPMCRSCLAPTEILSPSGWARTFWESATSATNRPRVRRDLDPLPRWGLNCATRGAGAVRSSAALVTPGGAVSRG